MFTILWPFGILMDFRNNLPIYYLPSLDSMKRIKSLNLVLSNSKLLRENLFGMSSRPRKMLMSCLFYVFEQNELYFWSIRSWLEWKSYVAVSKQCPNKVCTLNNSCKSSLMSSNKMSSKLFISGSAFMIGRFLTSVQWGMAADKYGRKPVMIAGVFSVLVIILYYPCAE